MAEHNPLRVLRDILGAPARGPEKNSHLAHPRYLGRNDNSASMVSQGIVIANHHGKRNRGEDGILRDAG